MANGTVLSCYHLENKSVKVSYLKKIRQPQSTIYGGESHSTEHIAVCNVCQAFSVQPYIERW